MPLNLEINNSIGYEYKATGNSSVLYSTKGLAEWSVLYKYVQGILYTFITESLLNGSHSVDVIAVDDYLNESTDLSGSLTIDTYLRPPKNLTHVFNVGDTSIDITWDLSLDDADGTFAFYNVYSNAGSGAIDYASAVAQLAAGVTTYNTGTLANGDWKWAVRSEKTDAKIEENVDMIIAQKIPVEPPSIGLPGADEQDTFLSVFAVPGGKAFLEFPYLGECDHFNVYWNTIGEDLANFNFASINDSFNKQAGIFQSDTTIQIVTTDNTEVYILVRPVNSTGIEQANTDVVTITLDGKNPVAASNLTLAATGDDSDSEGSS